jgi:hypothetical protein
MNWGTVVNFLPAAETFELDDLWHVRFDGGDSEDWDAEAVLRGLALHERHLLSSYSCGSEDSAPASPASAPHPFSAADQSRRNRT